MSITAVPEALQPPYAVETGSDLSNPNGSSSTAETNDISMLAYALWQQRGCPYGSPEIDWIEAESQLNNKPQA